MMILLYILFTLFGLTFTLGVPNINTENEVPQDTTSKPETTFSTHYLNNLDHKIETMTATLATIDTSIKQLQEKAHTWAIFHHHIDSWNDQMKVLEHKIDLIRRTQDEDQIITQKLTSQEFTLNHILSKVVYLSDSSCNNGNSEVDALRYRENGFGELKKIINGDRKVRNEIGTKLSNILRHVQNIEREKCHGSMKPIISNEKDNKMAKLIHPINNCNGSQPSGNFELSIKSIENKITKLINNIPQNELKKIIGKEEKITQKWEEILDFLKKINDRTIQFHTDETENHIKLSDVCQSMSSEITTFTESSDVLLKKIEKLVLDVQAKVEKLAEQTECVKKPVILDNGKEESEPDSGVQKDLESGEKIDLNDPIHKNGNTTDDVEEIDTGSNERDDVQEEVNFVQPSKKGCHELTTRVDGIYKFSTPETNAAGRDMYERYCVFATDGPAWTVFQNRGPYVVQENFNRSWNEYRDGFGSLEKDFWFGNEFIHQLVYVDNYELRIELEDFDEVKTWVEYSTFRIESEKYNYNLIIDGYRGAIPDAMNYHNEQDFSTYDRRNDKSVDACCACATGYASGWWFNNCAEANLNGVFHETPLGHNYVGIVWDQWRGDYSLKSSKMMLRPIIWRNQGEQEASNGSLEDP